MVGMGVIALGQFSFGIITVPNCGGNLFCTRGSSPPVSLLPGRLPAVSMSAEAGFGEYVFKCDKRCAGYRLFKKYFSDKIKRGGEDEKNIFAGSVFFFNCSIFFC